MSDATKPLSADELEAIAPAILDAADSYAELGSPMSALAFSLRALLATARSGLASQRPTDDQGATLPTREELYTALDLRWADGLPEEMEHNERVIRSAIDRLYASRPQALSGDATRDSETYKKLAQDYIAIGSVEELRAIKAQRVEVMRAIELAVESCAEQWFKREIPTEAWAVDYAGILAKVRADASRGTPE